ncbi:hypothetical protein T310_6521, partial [Rasamsonia emersonii CBS 393.64]
LANCFTYRQEMINRGTRGCCPQHKARVKVNRGKFPSQPASSLGHPHPFILANPSRLETSSTITHPFASHECRLCMAEATALALSADDYFLPSAVREELPHVQSRIWQGLEPREKWCAMWVDMIKKFTELYGARNPLIGSLGASGWANYLDGWCLEDSLSILSSKSSGKTQLSAALYDCPAEEFPYYWRSITGAALPYAVAIFKQTRGTELPYRLWMPYVQDVTALINLFNDVLSYTKELLRDEQANYATLTTRTKRSAGFRSRFRSGGSL